MIEEILDRLERIDHKEYCGGFEFADSSTFEEMGRCFDERKQLANYIKKLEQENKQLKESLDFLWNKFKKVNTANRKTKELIRKALVETDITGNGTLNLNKLLEILGDKE